MIENNIVYLKLTNSCQLNCKHCYNSIVDRTSSMSIDTLDFAIKFLINLSKEHIVYAAFHGGEPMLYQHDKILDVLSSTKTSNISWSMTTNLVYSIDDICIKIFKMLEHTNDLKPLLLTSWDYEIRFSGNQQKIWEDNVRTLINIGIEIQPIICLTNVLISNIQPDVIFKYFKNLGLNRFNFERITSTGRASNGKYSPKNLDMQKWLLKAYKIYEKSNFYIPLFDNIKKSIDGVLIGCRARHCMRDVITINPDGSLAGCPNTADKTYGTLNSIDFNIKKSFIACEACQNINCIKCKYFKYCNGDCFQLKFDESGCPGLYMIYDYLLCK